MVAANIPARLQWAVQMLDVFPEDEILEIGCGPGVAVSLICERLAGGSITALDRSAIAIERAAKRNANHIASGRAVLQQVDLAGLRLPGRRFDKIFAVNVNLFWVQPADAELRIIRSLLRHNGALYLVYETPAQGNDQGKVSWIVETIMHRLASHGFAATVSRASSPAMLCITARPATQDGPRAAAPDPDGR
jgi:SAM-dependent methyltransferase